MGDRYKINQQVINDIPENIEGSPQQCMVKVLGIGLNVLIDISTNLSIIADTFEKYKKGGDPDV